MCKNICNIQIKHTCNIRLKTQMQHWEQTLATYVYNHCTIWNISIYFATSIWDTCNVPFKHLKHILATCVFQSHSSLRHRAELRIVVRPGSGAAAPAPDPDPGNNDPFSWLPGHTRRPGACAAVAELARPASGTTRATGPQRRWGGSPARWRWPRQARNTGAVVENVARRSREVVEASSFLETMEVVQEACLARPQPRKQASRRTDVRIIYNLEQKESIY
jgi:hypothetical protein